tara:strand:- start:55 stop:714 length:660 start_codon:yes stop_codon:yes gene_type:complete
MAAVENESGLSLGTGIEYSWTVLTLSESSGIPEDRYFYDFQTKLVYYKTADGNIIKIFEEESDLYGEVDAENTVADANVDITTIPVPARTLSSDGDSITVRFHGQTTDGPMKRIKLFVFGVELLPNTPLNTSTPGVATPGHIFSGEVTVYRKSNTIFNACIHFKVTEYAFEQTVYIKSNETLSSTTLTTDSHNIIIEGYSDEIGGITILGSNAYTTKVL